MNPQNLTSFSDISFIFSVLYKLPPAVLCKTPTSRRPDFLNFLKRRQPRTTPRPALPHTRLMNALFVLRPAKLWAFNIGHPCPSLAKGELLLLSQAQPTIEGSPPRLSPSPQTPLTPHYPHHKKPGNDYPIVTRS